MIIWIIKKYTEPELVNSGWETIKIKTSRKEARDYVRFQKSFCLSGKSKCRHFKIHKYWAIEI